MRSIIVGLFALMLSATASATGQGIGVFSGGHHLNTGAAKWAKSGAESSSYTAGALGGTGYGHVLSGAVNISGAVSATNVCDRCAGRTGSLSGSLSLGGGTMTTSPDVGGGLEYGAGGSAFATSGAAKHYNYRSWSRYTKITPLGGF